MVNNRDTDLRLLEVLLDEHASELTDGEIEAFEDMRARLSDSRYCDLSDKQRAWAKDVRKRIVPEYENLVSSGAVPRGKEVPTPDVLRNLPKKPPGRR